MKEKENKKYVYGVYDTKLGEILSITNLKDFEVDAFFTGYASDIHSPVYYRVKDFDVYLLGELDDSGKITQKHELVYNLSHYVDTERVQYQTMVEVLNYLPVGYFKMPKEAQDVIKEKINDAVKLYVEKYADIEKLAETALVHQNGDEIVESEVKYD